MAMNEHVESTSEEQPKKNVSPGVALGIVMFLIILAHDLLLTSADIFLAVLVFLDWVLLTWIVFSLRKGMRAIVKDNFTEKSLPYRWFNRNGFVQIVISCAAGLIMSLAFVMLLKGLTLKHSFLLVSGALIVSGFLTGLFKSHDTKFNSGIMVTKHANDTMAEVVHIFVNIIVFTLVLAAITSAKDTHIFFLNEAAFGNFSEIAYRDSIASNGQNDIGRALVNLGLIFDAFRQAMINELFISIGYEKDSSKYFLFFAAILMFNFFKYLSLSAAFVLITISARKHVLDKAVIHLSRGYELISLKLLAFTDRMKKVQLKQPNGKSSQDVEHSQKREGNEE